MANYKKLNFGGVSVFVIAMVAGVSAPASASVEEASYCAKNGSSVECTYALAGGGNVFFEVPDGVTQLDVDLYGASGGSTEYSLDNVAGGKGGHTHARLAVKPGQSFLIFVGGAGHNGWGKFPATGGYNGGGAGGQATHIRGAGGGGGSDLRVGSPGGGKILVAGGGGGAGYGIEYVGGAGGGMQGNDGGGDAAGNSPGGGRPGTQGGPGKGGWGLHWIPRGGYNADGGQGGAGGGFKDCDQFSGGGGGGGYNGGGGGGASCSKVTLSGGGAGGSGYATPDALEATLETGVQAGDGKAVIRYSLPE